MADREADGDYTEWGFAEGDAITPELTAMRLLGGGSAYEAYLAFDEITYGPVVVKVVRPDQVDDEHTVRGLRREVTALEIANHPSVVRMLRHDLASDRPHLVMENVDGPRLSSLLRRHGRLAAEQYLPLTIEVASALHFFEQVDVVHLDIKPSNVIMSAPATLIDLSVARSSGHAADLRSPIGTDDYMAPEQCVAGLDVAERGPGPGFASDVYGLGATLFHAVAGFRPYPNCDLDATDMAARYPQTAGQHEDLPDDVPDDVAKLIYQMIDPLPENRPLPHEVIHALQPALERLPKAQLSFKMRR